MLGLATLRRIAGEVRRDVRAAYERDPAAANVSASEILAAWPGVHALLSHRVAHALDDAGVPIAPRVLGCDARGCPARTQPGSQGGSLAPGEDTARRGVRASECVGGRRGGHQ